MRGIILVVLLGMLVTGCSSTQKTTKTETTTTYPDKGSGNQGYLGKSSASSDDQKAVVEKTETTTTVAKPENPGILSSTIHAIGYVLELPFLLVGGLIHMIFGG